MNNLAMNQNGRRTPGVQQANEVAVKIINSSPKAVEEWS